MGLDITHYKAILNLPENSELIYIGGEIRGTVGAETKESFSDFNVPFEHFKKYIQLIDCPIVIDKVIIVENEDKYDYATKHFSNSNYLILINNKHLKQKLNEFENKKDFKELKKGFSSGALDQWRILNYYKTEKKEGFYYHQVGNQRKGMNENFWNQFCSNQNYEYAKKEDFDFAYSCISKLREEEWNVDFELKKKEFKKNFIDNFELGSSFMSVSY